MNNITNGCWLETVKLGGFLLHVNENRHTTILVHIGTSNNGNDGGIQYRIQLSVTSMNPHKLICSSTH